MTRGMIVLASTFAMLVAGTGSLDAGVVTLDFENVPLIHNRDVGNIGIGNYYAGNLNGPVFGSSAENGAVIADSNYDLNYFNYPPSSGTAVLKSTGYRQDLTVDFTTGPVSDVSFYYRSYSTLYLAAFDSSNSLIGTTSGPGNAATVGLPDQYLSLSFGSAVIDRIRVYGGVVSVIDDFTYTGNTEGQAGGTVPEPTSVAIFGLGALGLAGGAIRRRKKQQA